MSFVDDRSVLKDKRGDAAARARAAREARQNAQASSVMTKQHEALASSALICQRQARRYLALIHSRDLQRTEFDAIVTRVGATPAAGDSPAGLRLGRSSSPSDPAGAAGGAAAP